MLIEFAAKVLTFALRRAISDPAKRVATIQKAREIIKQMSELINQVEPVK